MTEERLQKILAAAGLGSRRSCEDLIVAGRVFVDGKRVTELGTKADPDTQKIDCDGEAVRPAKKLYYLINKPRGYVCTTSDPAGRPRAVDLVPCRDQRMFTVGRLDSDTEGLLIVTNDGSFAQQVAHPRYGVTKTYEARVKGALSDEAKQGLLDGIWIDGHRCSAQWVKILKRKGSETILRLVMQEGRNREVRRMLGRLGHRVTYLARVCIGSLEDKTLRAGRYRKLRVAEIQELLGQTKPASARSTKARKPTEKRRPKGKR